MIVLLLEALENGMYDEIKKKRLKRSYVKRIWKGNQPLDIKTTV